MKYFVGRVIPDLLRLPVDMLCQILTDKTIYVGKQYEVFMNNTHNCFQSVLVGQFFYEFCWRPSVNTVCRYIFDY